MEFDAFLQSYGWLGLVAYIAVKEVLPFLRDRVYPQKVAEIKAERDRLRRLEERAIQNEERQTKAIENMNLMMAQFAQAVTVNNERLAQLVAGHALHDRAMTEALSNMREKIAANTQPLQKVISNANP